MNKQLPAGRIHRVGEARGEIVHAHVSEATRGVWLRDPDGFVWLDASSGAVSHVTFAGFSGGGRVHLYDDHQHLLHRSTDALELWHRSDGLVARAEVPRPPPSPYAMDRGRPQWDGFELTTGTARLWYCGYDAQGTALLYLFDGATLELLDTHVPHSSSWQGRAPIERWGDSGAQAFRRFPDGEPIGFFGNVGDSFAFFTMYDVRAGKIVERSTATLEQCVREASDQTMHHIELLSANTLVTCDDLGLFAIHDIASEKQVRSVIQPLDAISNGDVLQVGGVDDTPAASLFQLRDLTVGASDIYLSYEVNEYASEEELETLGEFPGRFFLMCDRASLDPVCFVPDSDFVDYVVHMFHDGLFATHTRDRLTLFRWER